VANNRNLELVSQAIKATVVDRHGPTSIVDVNGLSGLRPDLYSDSVHMCGFAFCQMEFDFPPSEVPHKVLPPPHLCDAVLEATFSALFRNTHCQKWHKPSDVPTGLDAQESFVKAMNW